jgi:inner membrane protein
MMGHTHAALGFLAGAAYATTIPGHDVQIVATAGLIAAVAAIVPDIDHPQGSIRQKMGVFSGLLNWLPHRGATHTLAALFVWGLLCFILLMLDGSYRPEILVILVLGYASHLAADMATKSGIPLMLPISDKRWYLLPKGLRIRTSGAIEQLFAALVVGGIALYVPVIPATMALTEQFTPMLSSWIRLAMGLWQ